jgi:hypothetical protein
MGSNQEEENIVCSNNIQPRKEIHNVQQLPTRKRRRMWSNQEEENIVCYNFQPRKKVCGVQQLLLRE